MKTEKKIKGYDYIDKKHIKQIGKDGPCFFILFYM